MFDDHHGSVGNVDADFDDCRSDEYAELAIAKRAHDLIAFFGLEPAVDETDAKLLEQSLAHFLRHLRSVAHLLELFGSLDQRQHDKGLAPALQLLKNDGVDSAALSVAEHFRLNRGSSRRHLIDEGDFHIAVEHHGEAARDRRGAHEQHVRLRHRRRGAAIDQTLQRQPLHDAETMLLVDHAQAHERRAHLLLNQCVSADDKRNITAGNTREQRLFLPGRRCRRQQRG